MLQGLSFSMMLLIVIFIYSNEVAKGEISTVFAGLALWGQDLINETVNGLVFHFTQFEPQSELKLCRCNRKPHNQRQNNARCEANKTSNDY